MIGRGSKPPKKVVKTRWQSVIAHGKNRKFTFKIKSKDAPQWIPNIGVGLVAVRKSKMASFLNISKWNLIIIKNHWSEQKDSEHGMRVKSRVSRHGRQPEHDWSLLHERLLRVISPETFITFYYLSNLICHKMFV